MVITLFLLLGRATDLHIKRTFSVFQLLRSYFIKVADHLQYLDDPQYLKPFAFGFLSCSSLLRHGGMAILKSTLKVIIDGRSFLNWCRFSILTIGPVFRQCIDTPTVQRAVHLLWRRSPMLRISFCVGFLCLDACILGACKSALSRAIIRAKSAGWLHDSWLSLCAVFDLLGLMFCGWV